MTGIVNTFWKGASKIWNPIVGDKVKEVHMKEDLVHLMPKVKVNTEEEEVIPLADEEELKRARRRQRSSGGRASTVLTDDEKLGG